MKSNFIYSFDKQKMFIARYMAENKRSSKKYNGYIKSSIGQGGSLLAKSKLNKNYCIVSFQPRDQTYESTYFLLYDCHTTNLGRNFEFNHKL